MVLASSTIDILKKYLNLHVSVCSFLSCYVHIKKFGPANFKGRFSWLIPNGVIAIDPFLRGLNAAPAAKVRTLTLFVSLLDSMFGGRQRQ